MRRALQVALLVLLAALPCFAQTRNYPADQFGGWTGKPCTWPPPSKIAITNIVLSSGTYTATVASTTGIGPTTSPNTRPIWITGVTDSFYNSSLSAAAINATVASGTTLTWTGTGSHASSSGGYVVPANFYVQTIGGVPWECSPAGNAIWVQALGILIPPSSSSPNAITRGIFASKYSSVLIASVAGEYNFDTQVANANAIGTFSTGSQLPSKGACSGSCEQLPEIDADFADWYSTNPAHLGGSFTSLAPTIDVVKAVDSNSHFTSGVGKAIYDPFAPSFGIFLSSYFLSYSSYNGKNTTPYEAVVFIGGIDNRSIGTAAGSAFDTTSLGDNDNDLAAMLIQTAPIVAAQTSDYSPTTEVYADPLNYAKQLTTVPSGGCSYTTHAKECPLATLLSAEYSGSISALNTAWGNGGFYTTFGSSGKCVGYSYSWCGTTAAADVVGSGDGSTLTFSATLSSLTVSKFSLQICVTNCTAPVAGDASGSGTCIGPTISSCTINYATGALSITFTAGNAPPSGTSNITARYEANGFGLGTGLMDEDGSHVPWGANKNTLCLFTVGASPSAGTEGYACRSGNPGSLPLSTWNQNAATDLNVYDSHITAQYEDAVNVAFKAAVPNLELGTAQFLGNWGAPAPCSYFKGVSSFVDVIYTNMDMWEPIASAQTTYVKGCTTKPLYNETYSTACLDSGNPVAVAFTTTPTYTCASSPAQATQPLRATAINTVRVNELAANQFIGDEIWGGQHDCDSPDSPVNNWGIMTCADNPYNAHDAASGATTCTSQPGASGCGGEGAPTETGATRPFGDLFGGATGLTATNALWFSAPSTPVVPAPTSLIAQVAKIWKAITGGL